MAAATVKTLWLLHGVNLDMLGRRDPAHYGVLTLPELEAYVVERAAARGFAVGEDNIRALGGVEFRVRR